ncbi:Oxo-4-hydroxy-4-carboxy-5-ureidoimidazoline decarboxylase [Dichotomocladium elegans]|nr:Oxo-4-hydroxy-4-carboxy-5-ureidoimidazoline decarboxylase [Dichotomocladium elegans]
MLLPIQQLNTATPEVFLETIHTLFETAPPLASRLLANRPYASYSELIDKAESISLGSQLTQEEKQEVINAHPRIGESKTNLSAMSLKEQGYTDRQGVLSAEDEQTNAILTRLNQEYEDKYGFKFVVFVAGRPRAQIIPVIEARIRSNDREKELVTGIREMMLIARDRLHKAKF